MSLLEREVQLASLVQYAHEASNGDGRLVLVSGEAGIGKSALVEALRDELDSGDAGGGVCWRWGACDGLFTPRPLGPLIDMAQQAGGELLELTRTGGPRPALSEAVLRMAGAAQELLVLVVEDVHWADEATLDLLRLVGRRLRGTRVLLIVTYRDDELAAHHPLRVALGELVTHSGTRRVGVPPLTPDAVAELAKGSTIAPAELYRLTAGNPFFVREIVGSAGPTTVPPSARDAVLARAARLTDPARKVLETAALVGTRFEPDVLEVVPDADHEALDELLASGLVVSEATSFRFAHELTRVAVEDAVPAHRARSIHAAVLASLIAAGSTDEACLAYHGEGAGDVAAVLAWAPRAGARASALGSHREAAAQYERALRFWDDGADPTTLADLHDAYADELAFIDRWEDAAASRETALAIWRRLGERTRVGEDLRRLSQVMWRLCRGKESTDAMRECIDVLEPLGPNIELARAYSSYAFDVWLEDKDAAVAMLERADLMAASLGDPALRSDVLNNLSFARFQLRERWVPLMQEALRVALDADATTQAGRAYANAHAFHVESFEFAEAERWWIDGIAFCDERDITTFSACLRGRRALALLEMGQWSRAQEEAEHVLGTEASPVNLLTSQTALGLLRARRGEDGRDLLDAAVAAADGMAEAEYVALTRMARAESSWLAGDTESAHDDIAHARGVLSDVEFLEDSAVAVWERRLDGLARTMGAPVEPYDLAVSGRHREAAARWERLGCPHRAAMAHLDEGTEESLREALRRFDALGATASSDLARRLLRSLGVRSVPTGARASTRENPAGLTPREREVLALLCESLTNEEIAERLVISAKTVDHHVSAVLGKLGVPTRQAAAAEAERLGLAPATA